MALYRLAMASANTTSGSKTIDVVCLTGARPRLTEWGLFQSSATASNYYIERIISQTGRTGATVLQPENPSDPALTGATLIDSSTTTFSDAFASQSMLAYVQLPATIGTGVIWTFPRGLVFGLTNSVGVNCKCNVVHSTTINHVVADI